MIVVIIGRRSAKSVFAEYFEAFIAEARRQLLELIDAFEQATMDYMEEKEPPEEDPEDDKPWAGTYCPCSRQLPAGHRIPWYTSGFQ